jgi:hypothetical protein
LNKQQIPVVTKDVIESGRMAAKNLIATGHAGTRRVLRACDKAWSTGTNSLAVNPGLISGKFRDDLISIESQLTLLGRYVANTAAERGERAVNVIANTANSTVSEYERVFDLRVVQAMTRAGEPIAEVLRMLAALVANLSQQLAALIAINDAPTPATRKARTKSAAPTKRKATRHVKQGHKRA